MCAFRVRPFGDLYGVRGVAAETKNFVAGLRAGTVFERNRRVIHRDAPDDGTADAAYQERAVSVGKRERQAVGISRRDSPDAHFFRAFVSVAVTDEIAGVERAHLREARFEGQDGTQIERARAVRIEEPVEVDARADVRERGAVGRWDVVHAVAVGNVVGQAL